jgi:hypothetical protein
MRTLIGSVVVGALLGGPVAAGAQAPASAGDANELSRQATDPTASLMAFNFINDFHTSFSGVDDKGFEFRFQPVVPFRAFEVSNILRVVVPYQGSGPGNAGLQDVSIFDLVVLPQSWGRLGVGPVMSLKQADGNAPSKFAIGPAVGGTAPMSKKLNIGLFSQNLFASEVAVTQLQPIIAYQLGHGWALSAGDLQFTYDWKGGGWVSIPLGVQLGVVHALGGQPFRFSLNPQWDVADIQGAVSSKVVFTVTMLAPAK